MDFFGLGFVGLMSCSLLGLISFGVLVMCLTLDWWFLGFGDWFVVCWLGAMQNFLRFVCFESAYRIVVYGLWVSVVIWAVTCGLLVWFLLVLRFICSWSLFGFVLGWVCGC